MSAIDCYNSLIYPIFILIYIVFFCFLFVRKLEIIILIGLFVVTFFLLLKIYLDIFFFIPQNVFSIINKNFSLDFIKRNSLLYWIVGYSKFLPTFWYPFISAVITTSSLLILLIMVVLAKRSGINNDNSLSLSMSNLNGKKLRQYKILFVVDIMSILLSLCLLTYYDSDVFDIGDGKNMANGLLLLSIIISIVLSSYLLKLANDFYGIQQRMADGSGKVG